MIDFQNKIVQTVLVIIAVLLILAAIGWFSGAWAWWCPSHSIGNCTGQTSGCTGSNCPRPP